jgi:hypothetical protein
MGLIAAYSVRNVSCILSPSEGFAQEVSFEPNLL